MNEEELEKLRQSEAEMLAKSMGSAKNDKNASLLKTIASDNPYYKDVSDNIIGKQINVSESMYDDDIDGCGYDILELPSKGLIYPHKVGKLKVAHLTAADEDFITSPNLYKDGKIVDVILRRKILDRNINPATLCQGDIDAILLWLRADAYGIDFPVSVTDSETGERFETSIDLSDLKFKKFTLEPDENGLCSFTLPISKKEVKFKFLNRNDDVRFEEFIKMSDKKLKKFTLMDLSNELSDIIKSDSELSREDSKKLNTSITSINEYIEKIDVNAVEFNKTITYKLTSSIVEYDGVTNRKEIEKMVRNMRAGDASALRKYISENEPAVDFTIEVKNPRGGSFKTFLNIDSTILICNS